MPFVNIQPIKNGDSATPALFNSRFGKIADTINGGMDSANLVNGAVTAEKITDGAVTAEKIAPEPDWQAVTYKNSWVDYDTTYGGAYYYKDALGIVHLKGLVKNGNAAATFFTLPAGYRPSKYLLFPTQSNGVMARVDVLPTGDVNPSSGVSNVWVSLSGISFRAEA